MSVLSPAAVVKLWEQCLNEARSKRLGIFGAENSRVFREQLDRQWEQEFQKEREPASGKASD